MVGKVALTKKEGKAFVITGKIPGNKILNTPDKYMGFMLVPSEYGDHVTETEPRFLGDLNDIIDFQKLGDLTIKLVSKESEERQDASDKLKKTLDHAHDDAVAEEVTAQDDSNNDE